MLDIGKAVIARLRKGGQNFEILVDCDNALKFKTGGSFEDVLVIEHVYKDSKKGLLASEHEMKKIFRTDNVNEIGKIIIKEGEVQLSGEHRDKLREEKRKKIIDFIHRNTIDSKTGLPHPPQRIEAAMEEAKVRIDEFKNAEEQVQDIVEALRVVIPIKFEVREIAVKIPAEFSGKSYSAVKQYARVIKEEWQNNGSLVLVIEIPAGIQEEFFNKLNSLTHGSVESKVLKTK